MHPPLIIFYVLALLFTFVFVMALLDPVLPENEVGVAIKEMQSDLTYLLDDQGVPRDIQAALSMAGIKDVGTFAKIEDTPARFRDFMKDDIKLDISQSPRHRAMMAKMVLAWEAAGKRLDKRMNEQAEQRAGDLPRSLPKAVHLQVVRAFTKAHWELPDRMVPAPSYLEAKLEQIEDGELKPESWKEVTTKEDSDDTASGSIRLMPDGSIKVRRGRAEGSVPSRPEELRRKFKVMAYCWEFARLRLPGKAFFQDYHMRMWDNYVEWLLGEDVYENFVHDDSGQVSYRPSWKIFTDFEYQVRKRMCYEVNNNGLSLKAGLDTAMAHMPTMTKYWTLPVSLAAASSVGSSSKRQRSRTPSRGQRPQDSFAQRQQAPTQPPPPFVPPAGGKGKGAKGKGKGKQRGGNQGGGNFGTAGPANWRAGQSNTTPDGRMKCFKFQRGKCSGGCGKVHQCLVCNGEHGMQNCPRKSSGGSGDAPGAARSQGAGGF